ncbi:rod shape-determining protein MreD [Novosphingobium sp. 9]|uniref:rod shape-determining protein MreD n=1 Tax=Novosphingobium sp. 9 TaxID=2025349 RepID=UPI0021B68EA3|nr:rod shape-determining protein MreD [Novosphingobium sp. 9]
MSLLPSARDRLGGRPRINRVPSPVLAHVVPWLTIVLCSMVPGWLLIASAPVLPPFGFLTYLAWRQLRPGLLPIWAGLPLGFVDDLFSGQPIGFAVLSWSLAAIALDLVETRLPWRNFITEWLVAVSLVITYILLGLGVADIDGAHAMVQVIVPQLVISLLFYPLVGRVIAAADRFRLRPIRSAR